MNKAFFLASVFLGSAVACAAHAQNPAPVNGSDQPTESSTQAFGDLFEGAQAASAKGKLEQAIELTKEALKSKPDDRVASFFLARLTQARGRQLIEAKKTKEGYALLVVAAELMQELEKKYELLTPREQMFLCTALYNVACAYSVGGDTKQALSALEQAFESGFQRIDLATSDADLRAVRALPEFKTFLQRQLKRPVIAAHQLNERAVQLYRQRKYIQAVEVLRQALEGFRQVYPESEYPDGHPDLAATLNNMGAFLTARLDYRAAGEHYRQALQMRTRLYPANKHPNGNPEVAESLTHLGALLESQGEYEAALRYHREAVEMRRMLHPHDHPDLAQCLHNVGIVLKALGREEEALEYFEQAFEIRTRLYPTAAYPHGHPDLARSLNSLGQLSHSRGDDYEAERYFRQALEMLQLQFPAVEHSQGHPALAITLNNLGLLYDAQGDYGEAHKYLLQALEMNRRLFDKQEDSHAHQRLASSLSNLAGMHESQGNYGDARRYLQQALEMSMRLYSEATHPDGHPNLASILDNLGALLLTQGEYAEAEEYVHQALAMRQRLYSPQGHPHVGHSLTRLGLLLKRQGKFGEAKSRYDQALAAYQHVYPEHPHGHRRLATCLGNLGVLFKDQGDYAKARDYFEQALKMLWRLYPENRYPHGHPDLAFGMNNLGSLLKRRGAYTEALREYQQAADIFRRRYPAEQSLGHPELALCLTNLGFLRLAQGEYGEARNNFAEALSMHQGLTELFLATASEAEALNFLAQLPESQNGLVSVGWKLKEPPDALYAALWRSRRAVQRVLQRRQEGLGLVNDPKLQTRYGIYLDTRRTLARLALAPAGADPKRAAVRKDRLAELSTRKEALERELADGFPKFRQQLVEQSSKHVELAQHLPPRTVFIDLLSYVRYEQDLDRPGETGESGTRSYVAFVLRRGQPVVRVDLSAADPINAAVAAWRKDILVGKKSSAALALRRLVWEPIAKELPSELDCVYLCPDGRLTAVPWAALPGRKPGTVLLEEHALALVPHGQFLLAALTRQSRTNRQQGRALLVGNVNYDGQPTQPAPASLSTRDAIRGTKELIWPALAGTKDELEALGMLAGRRSRVQLTGSEANVLQLLAELPQTRWAHLATHGFFADAKFRSALQLDETAFQQPQFSGSGERTALAGRNPLVLSGLVLAGANLPRRTDSFGIPYGDGGILTAEAIAGLPLQEMELAVLSACETGLGDTAGGEGAYSLQRAFHIAGARNVVASLWKVDDQTTAALMRLLYFKMWQQNRPPLQALREAQLALYRHPQKAKDLSTLRGPDFGEIVKFVDTKPAKPRPSIATTKLWAAFVLSGSGR